MFPRPQGVQRSKEGIFVNSCISGKEKAASIFGKEIIWTHFPLASASDGPNTLDASMKEGNLLTEILKTPNPFFFVLKKGIVPPLVKIGSSLGILISSFSFVFSVSVIVWSRNCPVNVANSDKLLAFLFSTPARHIMLDTVRAFGGGAPFVVE